MCSSRSPTVLISENQGYLREFIAYKPESWVAGGELLQSILALIFSSLDPGLVVDLGSFSSFASPLTYESPAIMRAVVGYMLHKAFVVALICLAFARLQCGLH